MMKAYHICAVCEQELTEYERMYSDGVCPKCGNGVPGTIVHTIKCTRDVTDWIDWTATPLKIVATACVMMLGIGNEAGFAPLGMTICAVIAIWMT